MSTRGRRQGSVYRRGDGRWCAVIDLGTIDGKRQRRVVYAATAKEADKKLRDELRKVEAGIRATGRQMTVGAFLTRWLATRKAKLRPSTFRRYSELVNVHLIPGLGKVRLESLTPSDVDGFLSARLDGGSSPRTAHHMRAVLRAALSQAVRDQLVSRNVASLSDPVKVEEHEMSVFAPDQARRFLEAVQGDRLEALYATALAVGLRQGEALALRWQDVDDDYRTLRVTHGLQRVSGSLQLVPTKTKRSRRTIVLPMIVATALRAHRARQTEERLLAGGRWHDEDYVFASTIGTPIDAAELRRAFAAVLKRAGLAPIRFHDLRHSAATLMMAQGIPVRVVMETLGHSSPSLTLKTYGHVLPALQRDAADTIDRVLGGPSL